MANSEGYVDGRTIIALANQMILKISGRGWKQLARTAAGL